MYFYLVQNISRNEPEAVRQSEYVHVKADVTGRYTAIISEEPIDDPLVIEKSQEELQEILDTWIDEENTPPLLIDIDGAEIRQSYISLESFLA